MSRCFPYPPPGYVRNGASGEALIESIKLQRERENAKTERRKERKREKEEKKRREKKEKGKEKPGEICDREEKKIKDVKSHKGERSILDSRGGHLQKRLEEEAEQLEKSGLTEEHEQPICSENLCYSSDGTQNSNKRKRDTSPSNSIRNHGNIIRIRFPLQKHREPDSSLNKELQSQEQHCSTSTSVRTDSRAQQKFEFSHIPSHEQCSSTNTSGRTDSRAQRKFEVSHVPSQEQRCSTNTSGRTDSRAQLKFEISHVPSQEQRCSTNTSGRTDTRAQKNFEISRVPSQEQRCSINTSGRTDLRAQQKFEISHVPSQEQPTRTTIVSKEITPTPDREQLCSTSGRTEIFAQDGAGIALGSKLFENGMQKAESLYEALIENWVPPVLQSEQTDYDEQWLFETKLHDRHMAKRFKASNDVLCCGSPSLLPRSHYLPEADIYALPYTVPF